MKTYILKLSLAIFIAIFGFQTAFSQPTIPNRKLIVYTSFYEHDNYIRDHKYIKHITLSATLPSEKLNKIENAVENSVKEQIDNVNQFRKLNRTITPEKEAQIVRIKNYRRNTEYHIVKILVYENEAEYNKLINDFTKYDHYRSHEVIYSEPKISIKENQLNFYQEAVKNIMNYFDEEKDKELIEDFKEGYTGVRG